MRKLQREVSFSCSIASLVAPDRMVAGGALLRPAAVQGGVPEVDLVPTKVRQLTDPQGVTARIMVTVAVAPAVLAGRLDQLLDFGLGQILAGPQLGVRASSRRDCSIYSGWRYQFQCLAAGTIFVREFTIRKI